MAGETIDLSNAREVYRLCLLYAFRLEDETLDRARGLFTIWSSFNNADNPLRQHNHQDGRSIALNMMAGACLHETILILCAALDAIGNKGLSRTNRVSFPVVNAMLELAGVEDEAFEHGQHPAIQRAALIRFRERLDKMKNDHDVRSVKDFRDDFLAHNLSHAELRLGPQMEAITRLLDGLCILSGDCQIALVGKRTTWDRRLITVNESVVGVWASLAR